MNVRIRKAKGNEWEKLVDIYKRENLKDELEKVEQDAKRNFGKIGLNRTIWLAEVDRVVVGTIQLVLNSLQKDLANGKDKAMIHHLRVSRDFQSKGIGSKLNKVVESEAKKLKIKRLTLEVQKHNTKAREIYSHWGYRYLREGKNSKEIALYKDIS